MDEGPGQIISVAWHRLAAVCAQGINYLGCSLLMNRDFTNNRVLSVNAGYINCRTLMGMSLTW
jgi:hypothetical protein